jgi:hypothetical protein
MKLEDLQAGLRLAGVIPGQNVAVIAVQSRQPPRKHGRNILSPR